MSLTRLISQDREKRLRAAIYEALSKIALPQDKRRGVRTNARDAKKGCCIGYVRSYCSGTWSVSRYTFRRKYAALALLLRDYLRLTFPRFKYTSVQINEGSSALHVDTMNCGESVIFSVGPHVGGKLWVYPGRTMDVARGPCKMNGLLPHVTLPFKGRRFSIVYFKIKGSLLPASEEKQRAMRELGFASPHVIKSCDGKERRDLLPLAAAKLKGILSRREIGDWKNASLPSRMAGLTRETSSQRPKNPKAPSSPRA